MSGFDWLNSQAFTAFGQHIIWSDLAGNTIGLVGLALGWLRSVWTWPAQLLSAVILVAANVSVQQSGSVGKQLVIIVTALWGWQQWTRGRRRSEDGDLAIRFASRRERGVLVAAAAVGTLVVGGLFTAYPSLSWNPWPDAYVFVGTLVAMVAQARRLVEFWFAWLLVDVVGVPLNFSSGLAFSGLIYLVYGALVLWGMRAWWLRSRQTARPPLEGAPA
ncbi:membrane protein [Streptomyces sulfonofaciens]|uniref:Membrane protein n=1 Tax=Streptomyces sulfonofaciens TaxID=68272 RepID=A0A919G1I2_9ACTN|nr:nicotinamide mononucleotide transporter family protein [Streptomyces sulfonofaciens]GHH75859.1 membrane protein [Streptomyces sulfonofaciens]